MTAYYNEIDGAAAQWLRNLIEAGHIAPGIVDTRSIEDVHPSDLRGFTQCHFFAGIGVWSHALRNAGVPDSRSLWTGSCPCQPFSAAGAGAGFADERHLWPAFHHLIEQCRPATVLGEQVASKAAEPWIDALQIDMEALGYGVAAIAFPASSVGAPHIRDRLYWVADAQQHHRGPQAAPANHGEPQTDRPANWAGGCGGLAGGMADTEVVRREGQHLRAGRGLPQVGIANIGGACRVADANSRAGGQRGADIRGRTDGGDAQTWTGLGCIGVPCGMADTSGERWVGRQGLPAGGIDDGSHAGRLESDDGYLGVGKTGNVSRPAGPTNGFWRAADWLGCRDGKWRPVEPGTFPLVTGAAARVVRLRAYGNAINSVAAQAFIRSYLEATGGI